MNNDEADIPLVKCIAAANRARQLMARYIEESGDWKTSVKTVKMAEVKVKALEAGVDISSWDGTPAPVQEDGA